MCHLSVSLVSLVVIARWHAGGTLRVVCVGLCVALMCAVVVVQHIYIGVMCCVVWCGAGGGMYSV